MLDAAGLKHAPDHLGADAVIEKLPASSKSEELQYGLGVHLILEDFSTSNRYEMLSTVGDTNSILFLIEPNAQSRLKDELEGQGILECATTLTYGRTAADFLAV